VQCRSAVTSSGQCSSCVSPPPSGLLPRHSPPVRASCRRCWSEKAAQARRTAHSAAMSGTRAKRSNCSARLRDDGRACAGRQHRWSGKLGNGPTRTKAGERPRRRAWRERHRHALGLALIPSTDQAPGILKCLGVGRRALRPLPKRSTAAREMDIPY